MKNIILIALTATLLAACSTVEALQHDATRVGSALFTKDAIPASDDARS